MFTITAPVTFEIPREHITDMMDTAGYVIGYWATEGVVSMETYTVTLEEDGTKRTVGYEGLANALVRIGTSDEFEHYTISDYARRYLFEADAGYIDGELADCVLQVAVFGEIVYG